MRLAKFVLFLASIFWPAAGVAQDSAEIGRIADTMVRLCLAGGHTESMSGGGAGGAALSLRSLDIKGELKGEFKVTKSSAEGLVNGIDNAMSAVAADQADKVRACLQPVRERLLDVMLPPKRLSTFGALLKAATPEGPVQTALFLVLGLCVVAAPFVFRYYIGVLGQGAQPVGSLERKDYDALRASLTGGNVAARLYAGRLTKFLDAVDRFFGDAGMANRSAFPHAFGIKTARPLWTPRAFDRCLFLAVVYPIATIFIIWAVSGHDGPAEKALGLAPNVPGWERGLAAAVVGFEGFAIWSVFWEEGRIVLHHFAHALGIGAAAGVYAIIALAAVAAAAALTFAFGSVGTGAAAFGIAVVAAVAMGGRVAGAIAVAAAIPTVLGLAFGLAGASQSAVASVVGAAAAASIGTLLLCAFAIKHQAQGVFLLFFIPAMILACLAVVGPLLPLRTWAFIGPLLLFQGLLTLINAPFNWASIGLTRALLRRGLELGGWWPYLLALVDAALAGVIVALLALTMVIGVQTFDELVSRGGGVPFLPLGPLFDGIAEDPAAPEFWWIYALLLATMIPSIINLAIGGMAFTRGIPWLARLLLQWIPEGKAVPEYKRQPAAIGLTVQMFAGAFLGIAAQAFLAWVLIFDVMPAIGLGLLDTARAVAAFNLPARIGQLFAGFSALT